jgi:OOP family OmpA-OmpF porin
MNKHREETSMQAISRRVVVMISGLFLISVVMAPNAWAEKMQAGAFSLNPHLGGYVFDPDSNLKHRPVYGLGFGYNFTERWTAEGVLDYVKTEFKSTGSDMNVVQYRLDGLYHFRPDKKFVPYLAAGAGAITYKLGGGPSDTYFLLNYGVGAKYFLTPVLALRGDVRHLLSFGDTPTFGDTQNNFAYTFGATLFFGGRGKAAPAAPAVVVAAVPLDSDGDGVTDSADRCPGTPAGVSVDANGCPLDSDGDGVHDYLDKCPETPAGASVDGNGCPLDSDGDGIYDYQDRCPGTPKGARVDGRGCWVLSGVQFDTSKATLKPESIPILDAVLNVLKQNPDLKVEVEGHTDSTGSAAFNETLSANRAKAVLEFFVSKGIDRSRLSARGYGSSRPAASNDTVAGRAQNRRVELKPVR